MFWNDEAAKQRSSWTEKWNDECDVASRKFKKRLDVAQFQKSWMEQAGFVDVQEVIYKVCALSFGSEFCVVSSRSMLFSVEAKIQPRTLFCHSDRVSLLSVLTSLLDPNRTLGQITPSQRDRRLRSRHDARSRGTDHKLPVYLRFGEKCRGDEGVDGACQGGV